MLKTGVKTRCENMHSGVKAKKANSAWTCGQRGPRVKKKHDVQEAMTATNGEKKWRNRLKATYQCGTEEKTDAKMSKVRVRMGTKPPTGEKNIPIP